MAVTLTSKSICTVAVFCSPSKLERLKDGDSGSETEQQIMHWSFLGLLQDAFMNIAYIWFHFAQPCTNAMKLTKIQS